MNVKSPIHYMGNKFDLLPCLIEQFPRQEEVRIFYDVFGGSGTVSINVPYNNVVYNELDYNIFSLLKLVKETKPSEIIDHINKRIKEFDLNDSGVDIRSVSVSEDVIQKYKKQYMIFRKFYNGSRKDIKDLFTLSFYSFCNLLRFNSSNNFNAPYGNRCFLEEDKKRIFEAHEALQKVDLKCGDSFKLLKTITKNEGQFLYFDPPYQNSRAIYNESGWSFEDDERLFNELDRLTKLGVKWAYSNVLEIKGRTNSHIEKWAKKGGYTIIDFYQKQYSSIAKGNSNAREVLIINYKQRVKKYSIFDFL